MATIFYRTTLGTPSARPIYGVHPDRKIPVPDGIASLEVPGQPDQIPWPNAGGERGAVVDTTGVNPRIVAGQIPLKIQQSSARTRLQGLPDSTPITVKDLKDIGQL